MVQALSFLHVASYDFEEHDHQGQTCELYLFCEHSSDVNISAAVTDRVNIDSLLADIHFDETLIPSRQELVKLPRAPPFIS